MIELANEVSNEKMESVGPGPTRGTVVADRGVPLVGMDQGLTVNPVPPWAVEPKREFGSTRPKKTGSTRPVNPVPHRDKPPTFTGYKWKPSGLTGWELYTRKPSISKSGGRSSTGKYLGYYSAEAVKVLYAATQKTANDRRA